MGPVVSYALDDGIATISLDDSNVNVLLQALRWRCWCGRMPRCTGW